MKTFHEGNDCGKLCFRYQAANLKLTFNRNLLSKRSNWQCRSNLFNAITCIQNHQVYQANFIEESKLNCHQKCWWNGLNFIVLILNVSWTILSFSQNHGRPWTNLVWGTIRLLLTMICHDLSWSSVFHCHGRARSNTFSSRGRI